MRLDHVILACGDLDAAAERLRHETGVVAVPGGRHPRLGTANRLVPVGAAAYLELAAVVDPDLATATPFGRLVAAAAGRCHRHDGVVPAAWCVAVDDLDEEARRLGLEPVAASRTRPDGEVLRWRLAGVERAETEPALPFLIQWDVPADAHPGETAAAGPSVDLVEVRLRGDVRRLRRWLGGGLDLTTIVVTDGEPAVHSVVLDIDGRTVVLGAREH